MPYGRVIWINREINPAGKLAFGGLRLYSDSNAPTGIISRLITDTVYGSMYNIQCYIIPATYTCLEGIGWLWLDCCWKTGWMALHGQGFHDDSCVAYPPQVMVFSEH
jgi:hypothetical protein